MTNLGNDLYISSYTGASISVYDPFQPYHFGNQPGHNHRDIGGVDDISYRSRSTLTGQLSRGWLASLPDYGRSGGPLSYYYDPATEEKKVYSQVCGDASCSTLAHLPQQALIAVSTSISGGSGTPPQVSQVPFSFGIIIRKEKPGKARSIGSFIQNARNRSGWETLWNSKR